MLKNSNVGIIEQEMTNHENEVSRVYNRCWSRENKVMQILSVYSNGQTKKPSPLAASVRHYTVSVISVSCSPSPRPTAADESPELQYSPLIRTPERGPVNVLPR